MRELRLGRANRRASLRLLAAMAATAVGTATGLSAVRAQTAGRLYRLGVLRTSTPTAQPAALIEALRGLGYVQGRNLVIEARFADAQLERLPVLARELLQQRVDVLMAVGSAPVQACRDATSSVPILMFGNFDPVAQGIVTNLARPEANITGILISADGSLAAKRLELLREAVPRATRIALLAPEDPTFRFQIDETRRAAAALKVELDVVTVRGSDYAQAFAAIAARRAEALVVGAHSIFSVDRKPLIALAATHRLPAVYEWPEQVRDGGLMAYGTSLDGLYARVASYAAQLFAGKPPAELPVEQPTSFRLVVNRRTAKALGLALPQALMLRADDVIE